MRDLKRFEPILFHGLFVSCTKVNLECFAFARARLPDRPVCKSNASFDGMVLQKIFTDNHSETGTRYFEEIQALE